MEIITLTNLMRRLAKYSPGERPLLRDGGESTLSSFLLNAAGGEPGGGSGGGPGEGRLGPLTFGESLRRPRPPRCLLRGLFSPEPCGCFVGDELRGRSGKPVEGAGSCSTFGGEEGLTSP
jgi:hypothetical protein